MFRYYITMTVTVIAAALALLTGSGIVSGAEPPRLTPPAVAPGEAEAGGWRNPAMAELAAPGAALDSATLGEVAGGARLSAAIDTAPRQLATIKLWDEGRTRLTAPMDQGGGPTIITVTTTQTR
jgi:hypothetical protein